MKSPVADSQAWQRRLRRGLLAWIVLTAVAWGFFGFGGLVLSRWQGGLFFDNVSALLGAILGSVIFKDSARGISYGVLAGLILGACLRC